MSESGKQRDWEAIERAYRLGHLTIREIGRQHDVQPSTIIRRAEAGGWTRDATDEIRQRTQAALSAGAAAGRNTQRNTQQALRNIRHDPTEAEKSEAVQANVTAIKRHQRVLGKALDLGERLLSQADAAIADIEQMPAAKTQIERLQRLAVTTRAADLLNSAMRTIGNAIPLERQAFNIDDGNRPPPSAADIRSAIEEARAELARRRGSEASK